MIINKKEFGYLNNEVVYNYEFITKSGFCVEISPFGATIVNIISSDRNGKLESVGLGFDSFDDYIRYAGGYFGCIVGRVAGRIENGEFSLEGKTYKLAINNHPNSLHGGRIGFNQKLFTVKEVNSKIDEASISLTYRSVDGEENYPGNLDVEVTYLIKDQSLTLEVKAICDQTTIVDLTNHIGFNLSGNVKETIRDHYLMINSSSYCPLNSSFIPYKLEDVDNTVFDFRTPKLIKEALESNNEQIKFALGIDHPYKLAKTSLPQISLYHKVSGRLLEINTNNVGVVVYSGNFLNDKVVMRNNQKGFKNAMICLETQSLPNAINNSSFPSIILEKGKVYHKKTTYKFSIKD